MLDEQVTSAGGSGEKVTIELSGIPRKKRWTEEEEKMDRPDQVRYSQFDNSITRFNKRFLNYQLYEQTTVTYKTVLTQSRRTLFGFITLVLSLALWTFIDTTLAENLH